MLFDSHAHYNDHAFDSDRHEILSQMRENGIEYIMNAADSMKSVETIIELAEKYPFLYASAGVHPENAGGLTESDMDMLEQYAQHEKVRAIGEIGLDYHYDDVPREVQQKWFARQIDLARKLNLPVIVHDREAHEDTLKILRAHHADEVGGVLHCYSGSAEMVRDVLDLGFYLGFGGTLTFKNAKKVHKAAEAAPIERIVLETDCPYLAPEPHRGTRNSSLLMHFVAERLAQIKGISVGEVEEITLSNAKRLYRIQN